MYGMIFFVDDQKHVVKSAPPYKGESAKAINSNGYSPSTVSLSIRGAAISGALEASLVPSDIV